MNRHVDHRYPDGWRLRGAEIEVLMLHATDFHRQEHEVALLPVPPLSIHDRIATPLQHKDREPAGMPVLAGTGSDLLNENSPRLQSGVTMVVGAEIEEQLALAGLKQFAIASPYNDGTVVTACDVFLQGADSARVRIELGILLRSRISCGHALPMRPSFKSGLLECEHGLSLIVNK